MLRAPYTILFGSAINLFTACTKPKADSASLQKAPGVTFEIIEAPASPSGDTGYWPNLMVDPAGELHVAYCDGHKGDAKIAHRKDGVWTVEVVEEKGAVGKYMAARWESTGPELLYLDQGRKTLRYARKVADKWEFQDVATDKEDIGLSGRFVVTPDGVRMFVYYNTRNELMLSTQKGTAWTTERLTEAGAVFNLQVDARVTPDGLQLLYPDWRVSRSTLYLANVKTMAQPTVIDDEGIALKAAFVGNDIYYLNSRGGLLNVRTPDGKRTQLFDNIANFAVLPLSSGRLAIAQQVGRTDGLGEGALYVAFKDADRWTQFVVDESRPVGQYLSLAEHQGALAIAYYDATKKQLKLARLSGDRHH